MQLLCALRFGRGEVLLLRRIGSEVIELQPLIFKELQQFPVSRPDGSDRQGSPLSRTGSQITWKVPEQVPPGSFGTSAGEAFHLADSVQRLAGRQFCLGQFGHSGQQVHTDYRGLGHTLRNVSRPAYNPRDSHTAFVK